MKQPGTALHTSASPRTSLWWRLGLAFAGFVVACVAAILRPLRPEPLRASTRREGFAYPTAPRPSVSSEAKDNRTAEA